MKKLSIILLVFSSICFAKTPPSNEEYLNQLLHQAKQSHLSENPVWLKLLRYEDSRWQSKPKSAIHSKSFFLDHKGNIYPENELIATIKSFFSHKNLNDEHAICRFPARLIWLSKQLNIKASRLPKVSCNNYALWHKNYSIKSVSMIYATGYLGNPASYYGHILIKLDEDKTGSTNKLLDTSVNFGAIVPDGEDPISYIVKGLFGGYDSGFTHISYYFHTHNYGENELRDLWEYELNLTNEEVNFLVAHTWELLGKKYDYYFLDKNCAYRMAELLELFSGIKLVSGREFWLTPQEVIQKIHHETRESGPLVKKITYVPSRQSKLYNKYSLLTSTEQHLVSALIENLDMLNQDAFNHIELASQHRILDTLLDYYQFIEVHQDLSERAHKEKYRKVLSKRFQLPPSTINESTIHKTEGPHFGRPASRSSISYRYNKEFKSGLELSLRPAYYDVLDAQAGHIKNSQLYMANLSVDIFEDTPRLKNLDIVSITSIHGQSTMLPGDRNFAWKLYLGLQRQLQNCRDCTVPRFGSDAGLTFNFATDTSISVFAGGILQDKKNGFGNAYGRTSILATQRLNEHTNLRLEYEYRRHLDSHTEEESISEIEIRYAPHKTYDLRLSVKEHDTIESGLELGYYF